MSTCLVTGGAGFIGCALSSGLVARFDRAVVVDNLLLQVHEREERPIALHSRAEFWKGDVTDPGVWNDILKNVTPDLVIHLAAETGTAQSLRESSLHAKANIVGTTTMLDALARHNSTPKHFVLSSSRAVYGEGAWRTSANGSVFYPGGRSRAQLEAGEWNFPGAKHLPFSSVTTTPSPANIYAATKLAQEHILDAWCKAFESKLTILRLQNVFGPGQSLTNSYTGIVSLFARLAKQGKSIPLYEDGAMLRDFVFIDDVVSAFLAAIDATPPGTICFDIGSGNATTIGDVAGILSRLYDAPGPRVTGEYRLGDVRHASCDVAQTCERLPWRPIWPLERGLRALCRWIDDQIP